MIVWLQPAALWGLVLSALPVLVHLLRRRQADRVAFPSLRFVAGSQAAAVRLRPPSDLLLLAVRMAAVMAAMLAAAQPLWISEARVNTWNARIARAIVIDASPSMRSGAAGNHGLQAEIAAVAERESQVFRSIRLESPDVDEAAHRAGAWLESAPPARREMVIVSDFQLGAVPERALREVSKRIGVRLVKVASSAPGSVVLERPRLVNGPDGASVRDRFAISAAGTELLRPTASDASAGRLRMEGGGDVDRRRLLETLARAGTPAVEAPASIVLRFGKAIVDGGVVRPDDRWMLAALVWIERDLDLARLARGVTADAMSSVAPWVALAHDRSGRPLVRAAASSSGSLVVDIAAAPTTFFAAAAARATLRAADNSPALAEAEILRVSDQALTAYERPAPPVTQEDWRRAEMSDAPWLWIVGLGAIALETWLRRQTPWTEDARAAA